MTINHTQAIAIVKKVLEENIRNTGTLDIFMRDPAVTFMRNGLSIKIEEADAWNQAFTEIGGTRVMSLARSIPGGAALTVEAFFGECFACRVAAISLATLIAGAIAAGIIIAGGVEVGAAAEIVAGVAEFFGITETAAFVWLNGIVAAGITTVNQITLAMCQFLGQCD